MGKVFIVGLGDGSSALCYTNKNGYYVTPYWGIAPIFAEECPGNFLDIHTSKAFNERGDKDCRHRSVEGLILFSSPNGSAVVDETIPAGIPERYSNSERNEGATINKTWFAFFDVPGTIYGFLQYCLQTALFLDAKTGRPRNRLRNFKSRSISWNPSMIDLYNASCSDSTYEYEFQEGSGRDWDYVLTITSNVTYHPRDDHRYLVDVPCPYSVQGPITTSIYRISAREDRHMHYMRYYYRVSDSYGTDVDVELKYTVPLRGMEIPWYYSRDGILERVSKIVLAATRQPMSVLSSLTKPAGLPLATKKRLVRNALDDIRSLRINSIAYLQDLTRLKDLLEPLRKLKKAPYSPKTWANLWLTYRYGIRLFMLDTKEILTAIEKQSEKPSDLTHVRSVWHSTPVTPLDKDVKVVTHCKLLFDFRETRVPVKITQCLRNWDLILSRENIWDFIPYSFVLDWVLPVGDYLADLDAESDLTLYKSKFAIFSQKTSYLLEGSFQHMLDIAGYNDGDGEYWLEPIWGNVKISLNLSSYNRWHENPRYATSTLEFSNGLNLVRTVDAVALTVQRKK